MKRSILIVWGLVTLAIGGWAWWYLFSAGDVHAGQRPLADEAAMRDSFNKNVSKTRIVAVLSPTTPADLATAQQLQALLMEYENDTLDAHVVWQPMESLYPPGKIPPSRWNSGTPPEVVTAQEDAAVEAAKPTTIFGEDLISEKSLDEVILSYLAEDLADLE